MSTGLAIAKENSGFMVRGRRIPVQGLKKDANWVTAHIIPDPGGRLTLPDVLVFHSERILALYP